MYVQRLLLCWLEMSQGRNWPSLSAARICMMYFGQGGKGGACGKNGTIGKDVTLV